MRTTYIDVPTRSVLDVSVVGDRLGEVNRINVPLRHRGQGVGRRLMREMLDDADAESITLVLDINPYGEMSYEELASWYSRVGFEFKGDRWWREPQS